MKRILFIAGATAAVLATSAYAGIPTALGVQLGTPLPLAGLGVMGIAAVSLITGIRMLRRRG